MSQKQVLKLLDAIHKPIITLEMFAMLYNALEQIILLHETRKIKRLDFDISGNHYYKWFHYCTICRMQYPCPTIQAIIEELPNGKNLR